MLSPTFSMPAPKKLPTPQLLPAKAARESGSPMRNKQRALAEARRKRVRAILERTAKARAEIDKVRQKGFKTKGPSAPTDAAEAGYADDAMTLPPATATAVLDLEMDEDVMIRAELVAHGAGIDLGSLIEAVILRSLPSMKLGSMPRATCSCCPDGRCAKVFSFRGKIRCGCAPVSKRATGKSPEKT